MKLTSEELAELQRRINVYDTTPSDAVTGSINLRYEAKKNIDNYSKEMSIKYGYDYTRYYINTTTGEIVPL